MNEQFELELRQPREKLPQLWSVDEIYDGASVELLKMFKEDGRIERKSARVEPRQLGECLSMYANTSPDGGVIVIGMEDDGRMTGCGRLDTSRLNAIERLNEYCPDARYDTKRLPIRNDQAEEDFVILLRVSYQQGKLVETTRGDAFIRRGDSKHRLNDDEKRELRIAKGEVHYELERVDLKYPNDFDTNLARALRDGFVASRGLKDDDYSEVDVLCLCHLGQRNGDEFMPNLAAALLLAKDPIQIVPGAKIRFLRFDGTEEGTGSKFNAIKDIWIEGPVPRLIDEAERVVKAQMRDFTRLGSDGRFYTKPEYPEEAWLEAIVNACAHRSYNIRNSPIFIKMFDDRFVVESPGGFVPPVTPANIYEMHNPRNPFLMAGLLLLQFVKCAREGTRRMRAIMEEADLPPPEFHQAEVNHNLVRVTLRNNIAHRKLFIDADVAGLIGKRIFGSLTENERMLVNFLAERGEISVSDAVRILGKDWGTAKKILTKLVDSGILQRTAKTNKPRDPSARFRLVAERPQYRDGQE